MTDSPPDKIVRLFFGFELPWAVRQRATGLRTLVVDPKKVVRWVKSVNLHLTVRFLGSTPEGMVPEIVASLGSHCGDIGPIKITIEGTGVFPQPTRPRVLWLGVEGEVESLQRVESVIHQAVEPLGFPREEREYIPHITLGKVRYPQKVTPEVSMYIGATYEPVDCTLKVLHLYASGMGENGIFYTPLASFPLEISDRENS